MYKELSVEATIWIKVWVPEGADEEEIRKKIRFKHNWDDYDVMDITKIEETGGVE